MILWFFRWEAARIPKVKVVRVNKVKEQSLYMPQIPDVMKCPDSLLPHKEWEDSFLSEFSQLREVNILTLSYFPSELSLFKYPSAQSIASVEMSLKIKWPDII